MLYPDQKAVSNIVSDPPKNNYMHHRKESYSNVTCKCKSVRLKR